MGQEAAGRAGPGGPRAHWIKCSEKPQEQRDLGLWIMVPTLQNEGHLSAPNPRPWAFWTQSKLLGLVVKVL